VILRSLWVDREHRIFHHVNDIAITINAFFKMIVDPMTEVTGLTKFDIYFEDKRWPCAIYLSEEEVAALMKANGVSDVRALVDIYGLTLLDLPYPMIVDRALPRECWCISSIGAPPPTRKSSSTFGDGEPVLVNVPMRVQGCVTFETREGVCRVMPRLTKRLTEAAIIWTTKVAPIWAQICSFETSATVCGLTPLSVRSNRRSACAGTRPDHPLVDRSDRGHSRSC
jgi:hypothetical protein